MKKLLVVWFVAFLAMNRPVHALFGTAVNGGDATITITWYTGPGGAVTIPATINGLPVTSIGESAFAYTRLTSVTIPDSVTFIGDYAFAGCGSLTSVAIPDSVTSLGRMAFVSAGLTNATIGNGVASIGDSTFDDCVSLISVTIGNSVAGIGESAFAYTRLTSVTIPDSVTYIGDRVFVGCTSLTSVTIGSGVTSIGLAAFARCYALADVYFRGDAPYWFASDLFYGDNHVTVHYLPGTKGWGQTMGGRPTTPWVLPYPVILKSGIDAQTGRFVFTISWANAPVVVVEACTNLKAWVQVETVALTGGSAYFSDPESLKYPARFYRLRSP